MARYGVAEAKDGLPALIDKAIAGEEVVITRHGRPVAELRSVTSAAKTADVAAATRLLHQRVERIPRLNVPANRFYDWLYDEE